ncbi:MAG: hypothetical protein BAA02_13010 [Paenibacillaceae bacterium ZCTH02-B3]|nr:MAG: hypothetical protein BAA02_13010 [Paenibacillaceae bacterium ZCTH02-B3]
MKFLDKTLTFLENFLAGISLSLAALLTMLNIVMRYFFNRSFIWGEEAVVFLVIYSAFIGTSIAMRYREHITVDILGTLVRGKGVRALEVLSVLLILVYCLIIGAFGWLMVTDPSAIHTITPSLKLPLWIPEISIPVGLTLLFIRAAEVLWKTVRGIPHS